MIYDVWLPSALQFGIDYNTFWDINPRVLEIYKNNYIQDSKRKRDEMNFNAYLHGYYNHIAVGCAFSKSNKYPEKPVEIFKEEDTEMSDEEKMSAEELLLTQLQIMEINFNSNKNKNNDDTNLPERLECPSD